MFNTQQLFMLLVGKVGRLWQIYALGCVREDIHFWIPFSGWQVIPLTSHQVIPTHGVGGEMCSSYSEQSEFQSLPQKCGPVDRDVCCNYTSPNCCDKSLIHSSFSAPKWWGKARQHMNMLKLGQIDRHFIYLEIRVFLNENGKMRQ